MFCNLLKIFKLKNTSFFRLYFNKKKFRGTIQDGHLVTIF